MQGSIQSSMQGKTVLLTGGNTGIGKYTAIGLARQGAKVVFTSRNPDKGEAAAEVIRRESGNEDVECVRLDLASFASIEACAAAFLDAHDRLDVLVLNAGLVLDRRSTTDEGFETTFGVNHLGHFLLTERLLPLLKASAPARIVVVASDAHKAARDGIDFEDLMGERKYSTMKAYAQSKLANILYARELAGRLEGSGVTVNALHPGVVRTDFGMGGDIDSGLGRFAMALVRPFSLTPEKGARTSIFLASDPSVEGSTGGYYARCKPARSTPAARDMDVAKKLWTVSEQLLADGGA